MKTLDEVIKAMDWCTDLDQSGCNACPYADSDQIICFKDDALFYLKEYRSKRERILTIERKMGKYEKIIEEIERNEDAG